MKTTQYQIELIKKAKQGDRRSLNRLAELGALRLHEFVFRLTLDDDLTRDIVQESILEMLKIYNKLRQTEQFWYWLYGIAYNKMKRHYQTLRRRKTVSLAEMGEHIEARNGDETVANAVTDEFREIVVQAMSQLEPRHRAILTLRCYDKMSYGDIAGFMGCTEFGARALFYRAKKAMTKKLALYGLSRGSVVMALVLFGKMTASSKAAAANIAVTSATLRVGATAALAGTVMSKSALVCMTAGALAVGTAAHPVISHYTATPSLNQASVSTLGRNHGQNHPDNAEKWYFFPEGGDGPLMMRWHALQGKGASDWHILQNAHANYQRQGNTIHINNHRFWDWLVQQVPTDPEMLGLRLGDIQGVNRPMRHVSHSADGLFVIAQPLDDTLAQSAHVTRHHNVLHEDYFLPDWPTDVRVVDNRDMMHKRGWTYFSIEGVLAGRAVSGTGRVPFVYATSKAFSPQLSLKIGKSLSIIDTRRQASWIDTASGSGRHCLPGSFFKGLPRPWMGLHALDTIRRDAAEQGLSIRTQIDSKQGKAQVKIDCPAMILDYTIGLYQDLVEEIVFSSDRTALGDIGRLRFIYHQDINDRNGFRGVSRRSRPARSLDSSEGMLWLVNLTGIQHGT